MAEDHIAGALRLLLDQLQIGESVPNSDLLNEFASILEWSVPAVINEGNPEFNESSDGVIPFVLRKLGPNEAEFVGSCILINDQTEAPLHLRLQISDAGDEVTWLECRFGKRVHGKMERRPYGTAALGDLAAVAESVDAIDWHYAVGFGKRRWLPYFQRVKSQLRLGEWRLGDGNDFR